MQFLNKFLCSIYSIGAGIFLFTPTGSAQTVPYSPRLTEWLLLTCPAGLHLPPRDYANFLKTTPEWPLRARITWRFENSLQQETNPTTLKQLCPLFPLTQFATLIHCTSYLSNSREQARSFWRRGLSDTQSEQKLLSLYGSSLQPEDQWARYQNLEKKGLKQAALRQINRLSPSQSDLARARFAQRFALPTADELFASQESVSSDNELIRLRLHLLRQQNRLDEGYMVWKQTPFIHNAPTSSIASEILAYIRLFLRSDQEDEQQKALELLASLTQLSSNILQDDALFLNGYTRLFLLNRPQEARRFFLELSRKTSLSKRAEGLYWLGRCAGTESENEEALTWFRKAASNPTVFYGQLALAHLTHSPFFDFSHRTPLFKTSLAEALAHIPQPDGGPIPRSDLVQAIQALVANNDRANATIFITYLYAHTETASALISVAALSSRSAIAKGAILSAHKLEKAGIALYPSGYPLPYDIPPSSDLNISLPPPLLPALIRQESSGDPDAISPSPAYGLMQLRLPTAQMMAQKHRLGTVTANTLLDSQTNMLLGSLYLSELLAHFNGSIPYALAGYNAGPSRVKPIGTTSIENDNYLLKWITLFPFKETRGYIQHIMSDMALYDIITQ